MGSWCLCLSTFLTPRHMIPTSFYQPHCALTCLCDTSFMCSALALQKLQKAGSLRSTLCSSVFPTHVFDLMDTKHMRRGFSFRSQWRKQKGRKPWKPGKQSHDSAVLGCPAQSALFGRETLTTLPRAKAWGEFELQRCLKCSTWFLRSDDVNFFLPFFFFCLSALTFSPSVGRQHKGQLLTCFGEISWLHLIVQSLHRCESGLPGTWCWSSSHRETLAVWTQGFLCSSAKNSLTPHLAGRTVLSLGTEAQPGLRVDEMHISSKSDHFKSHCGKEVNRAQWYRALRGAAISAPPRNQAELWCCSRNDWKKKNLEEFINHSNCSSQELCWEVSTAQFVWVNVTQPSLCHRSCSKPRTAQSGPTCLLCFWFLLSLPRLCSPASSCIAPVPAPGATEYNSQLCQESSQVCLCPWSLLALEK